MDGQIIERVVSKPGYTELVILSLSLDDQFVNSPCQQF